MSIKILFLFTLLNSIERSINGKARWEKVGVMIDKGDKKSVKLDLIQVSKEWDGWLVVSDRKEKKRDEPF